VARAPSPAAFNDRSTRMMFCTDTGEGSFDFVQDWSAPHKPDRPYFFTVSATNPANCFTSCSVVSKEHIQRTTDCCSFHT